MAAGARRRPGSLAHRRRLGGRLETGRCLVAGVFVQRCKLLIDKPLPAARRVLAQHLAIDPLGFGLVTVLRVLDREPCPAPQRLRIFAGRGIQDCLCLGVDGSFVGIDQRLEQPEKLFLVLATEPHRPAIGVRSLIELHRPEIFRSDIGPVRRVVRVRAELVLGIRDLDRERLLAWRRTQPRFKRLIGQGGPAVKSVEPRGAYRDNPRHGGEGDVCVEGDWLAGKNGSGLSAHLEHAPGDLGSRLLSFLRTDTAKLLLAVKLRQLQLVGFDFGRATRRRLGRPPQGARDSQDYASRHNCK